MPSSSRVQRLPLEALDLQFLVDRGQLFVAGLQFLVRRLQLLVGGLQLFVGGLDLLVERLCLLVGGLELLDHRVEVLARRVAELLFERSGPAAAHLVAFSVDGRPSVSLSGRRSKHTSSSGAPAAVVDLLHRLPDGKRGIDGAVAAPARRPAAARCNPACNSVCNSV
jgi:hypothetical protein